MPGALDLRSVFPARSETIAEQTFKKQYKIIAFRPEAGETPL